MSKETVIEPVEAPAAAQGLAPLSFRRLGDSAPVDAYVPDTVPWLCESGAADFDMLFGGKEEALRHLAEWLKRPSSSFSIRRMTLLFAGERAIGGVAAMSGKDLRTTNHADALSLFRETRQEGRQELLERFEILRGDFPPVHDDDYFARTLGLLPEFRGRGLGKILHNRFIQAGVEAGHPRFRIDVEAGNTVALAIYQKAGFRTFAEGTTKTTGKRTLFMRLDATAL